MASIYEKQNERESLKFLWMAQKHYSRLKILKEIKFFWIVVVTILTVKISNSSPEEVLLGFTYRELEMALIGINCVVILIANPANMLLKKYQEYAANIQQCFDACCFNNSNVNIEIINKEAYLSHDQRSDILACELPEDCSKLINWYENYTKCPFLEQILYSQRECLKWSEWLKIVYLIVYIAMFGAFLFVLTPYLEKEFSVEFFAILSNGAVLLEHTVDAIFNISYDFYSLRKVRTLSNSIDVKNIHKTKLQALQKSIYDYRKTNYQVPDFIYCFFRNHLQDFFRRKARVLREGNV